MDFEVDIKLPFRTSGITVCGDGEVDIVAQSGYNEVTVSFELDELEEMVRQARAHKKAYNAYIANDYEDLPEIGTKARPKGWETCTEYGTITKIDDSEVLIEYPHCITTPVGFTRVSDVWLNVSKIEIEPK